MNSELFQNSARFVFLILLQGLLLSHINFLGFVNPYLYILFILLLPVNLGQGKVLVWSFLLGLCVDFFQYSGGVHATACLVIAYLRPLLLRLSFGISYEHQTIRLQQTSLGRRLQYVLMMVFVHHFVLFSMEIFNYAHILLILKDTLLSGIFSTLVIFLTMLIFVKQSN